MHFKQGRKGEKLLCQLVGWASIFIETISLTEGMQKGISENGGCKTKRRKAD